MKRKDYLCFTYKTSIALLRLLLTQEWKKNMLNRCVSMSGALPFYFDRSGKFSDYLRGVWPSQSDRSLGVAGGSSLSSLLWADSLFLSASKGSGHWVMYTPFLLLLVSPRYRLALPDGEDASEGVSLGASLPSLAWLSRGSSGGGVMITSCGSILVSKKSVFTSLSFLIAYLY